MPNPGYSDEAKAEWRRLAETGMNNNQIAAAVGVRRDTINRWVPPRPKFTEADIEQWRKALDEEGMSYTHVAQVFKVSLPTVRRYLPGRGWTKEQIGAHGSAVRRFNATKIHLVG